MNYRTTLILASAVVCAAPTANAATEIFRSRTAYDARLDELNAQAGINLPSESQLFVENIPDDDSAQETGPNAFTYRDVPLAVSAEGNGVFDLASSLGYQGNGNDAAPLVIETSVPVNAIGFDILGFGSRDIDPFFICLPADYELRFTGGDLVDFVVDTEVANGNGNESDSQFFGIIDMESPFSVVELNNTGFFDGSFCGFSGTEPDEGDTIRLDDLTFAEADFGPICGDVDASRGLDADDVAQLRASLVGNSQLLAPDNCSVRNGADSCDMVDAVVLARAVDVPTALPGVQDVCRSNSPPPADLAASLIGYWPFDGGATATATRYPSHSPRGIITDVYGAGDARRAAGRVGDSALSLPDVSINGFVEVTDDQGEVILEASNALSVAAWLRPTGPGASPAIGGTIFSKAGEYEVFRRPDGTLRWQKAFGSGPTDVDFGISTAPIPLDTWTHIVLTFASDGTVTLYLNGALSQTWQATAGIADNVPDNDTLRLGSSSTAPGRQYEGDIDEAAIWLRTLDQATVDYLYDAGFGRKAHELRVFAANFDVAGGSVWRVTETSPAPYTVTTDSVNLGDVSPLVNGSRLYSTAGLMMPTIRETRDGPSANLPLATSYEINGEEIIAITNMIGSDAAEIDARVSFAYFPFVDGWIAGRVRSNGELILGNGVTSSNVARVGTGTYDVTIPGVTDARAEGMLFAVDAVNGSDNVIASTPLGDKYRVVSYDNDGNFQSGQDLPWNFVWIPYDAANLVAAEIDQQQVEVNGTGNSFVTELSTGITEITIPGENYREGVLLLGTGFTADSAQDNLYTYAPGGSGRFISHSRDLPNETLQRAQYHYAYVSFTRPPQMPMP